MPVEFKTSFVKQLGYVFKDMYDKIVLRHKNRFSKISKYQELNLLYCVPSPSYLDYKNCMLHKFISDHTNRFMGENSWRAYEVVRLCEERLGDGRFSADQGTSPGITGHWYISKTLWYVTIVFFVYCKYFEQNDWTW